MTQPQVLQAPRTSLPARVQALADACDDIEFLAQFFDLHPFQLDGISSETVYVWAEQLEAAARKMQAIARTREAQGE